MAFVVEGKNFIVTGGATGLGALHVWNYLEQGAKAVAIVDVAEDAGNALAERANEKYPGRALFLSCDVSKEDEIEKAFAAVLEKFKQVDVIINNAGVMNDASEIWRLASDVNWQGVVSFTLKGFKHMSKDEGGAGGVIVNISSIAALLKSPVYPIYFGSKGAVMHFCQCIASAPFFAHNGVRILCMCFGATDTPLLHNLESRIFDTKVEEYLKGTMVDGKWESQKPESAVAAVDYIIKNAPNGTTWLSSFDKPARNITPEVDAAYAIFENLLDDNAQ